MRMSNNFFLARSLLQEDIKAYKISKLRHCVSAGEPVNEEVSQLYRICYLNFNFDNIVILWATIQDISLRS